MMTDMLVDVDDPLDNDGYPTDDALARIQEWPYQDSQEMMDFIRCIWWMPEWGWHTTLFDDNGRRSCVYNISTGGWSGNESIISAMRANHRFWSLYWVQSHRGGHYIFEVDSKKG